jgi:hypothetical protein
MGRVSGTALRDVPDLRREAHTKIYHKVQHIQLLLHCQIIQWPLANAIDRLDWRIFHQLQSLDAVSASAAVVVRVYIPAKWLPVVELSCFV